MRKLNQNKIFDEVINDSTIQAQIVDLNQDQLQHGLDSVGDSTGEYSKTSVNVYGKTPGKIVLKDTGEFYDSMKVAQSSDSFYVSGDTIKEGGVNLLDRWPDALGLTDESIAEILPEISEKSVEIILETILEWS